jgi:SpoVK/Ycf46/Vps4 family AAA+-type ATPase
MKELMGEHYDMIEYKTNTELNANDLIQPEDIVSRKLFYNHEEINQINTLSDLLHPEKFTDIQDNLKKAGYKSGFCVLLHGTPGTGKTETVLQLAKSTGRLVLKVDIATIRDKFVGETEKNISKVFQRYTKLCRKAELTPILLFNEADALFNKRVTVKQSVDQMNNSMQNILLEALENFEGILFATTNLAPNMDKAFERRFLYKIKFRNPTDEARQSIWKVHFPDLENGIIDQIAAEFHLSGGQIENVVRKAKLQSILYNDTITFDALKQFCDEESIGGSGEMKQIGFKRD